MNSLSELSREIRELPTSLLDSFVMLEQSTLTMRALLKRMTDLCEIAVFWFALENYMRTGRLRKSYYSSDFRTAGQCHFLLGHS